MLCLAAGIMSKYVNSFKIESLPTIPEIIHHGDIIQTKKGFFEKKHSCDFVFQNQPIYVLIL